MWKEKKFKKFDDMVAYKNRILDRYEMIRTDWEFIENGYLFRWCVAH